MSRNSGRFGEGREEEGEVFFAERPGYAHEFAECEGGGGDEEAPGEE